MDSKKNSPSILLVTICVLIILYVLKFDQSSRIIQYEKMLSSCSKSHIASTHRVEKDSLNELIVKKDNINISLKDSVLKLNKAITNLKYKIAITKVDSI